MINRDPTPAELFLEGVESYHILGGQILQCLEASAEPSFGGELPKDLPADLSATELFEVKAAYEYGRCLALGDEIEAEYERSNEHFEEFVGRFSFLYPNSPVTSMLEDERPVTRIIKDDALEDLLKVLAQDPRFNEEGLADTLLFMYICEAGAIELIKSMPNSERLAQLYRQTFQALNRQLDLRLHIDDFVAKEVLAEEEAGAMLDDIQISYSETSPRQSHLDLVYKTLYRDDRGYHKRTSITPKQTVVLEGGQLMAVSKASVVVRGTDTFETERVGQLEPIDLETQELVLGSLKKAVIVLAKLSEMTIAEIRARLNLDRGLS
jgi:hypothetical protein